MKKTIENNSFKRFLINKVIMFTIFIVIVTIFCCVYALLLQYGKVNTDMNKINLWTFVLGIIAFLILGVISGLVAKKNGLLEGLTAGLFIILLVLLINLIIEVPFLGKNFVKIATYLTASSVGGIIGVNIKKTE